jgi:hypothetical protein
MKMTEKINHPTDWWGNLSEAQKQHIEAVIADAEMGRTISSKEFWDKLKNKTKISILIFWAFLRPGFTLILHRH